MRDLRTTVGVGVLISLIVIVLSGFVIGSSHEFLLVVMGFGLGMGAVYLHDRLKARHAKQAIRK
jgi:hypothetical protein